MWPAMAERVRVMLESPAGTIRGPDRLEPDMRQQIDAAAPRQAIAKPKKPRKLLVTDIQMYSGHSTIPHGNLLLELMGKYTGAFEPVFSNDLNLLKYPKIKEFDAVYLNNVCGMVHNDPEVREGILRFVREGGGIGGHHAVTFANNNWPEFAEMMGGWAGAHHVEKQMIKVDDPEQPARRRASARRASSTPTSSTIFPPSSPYSREKQHVLLSIDVEQSDRATDNRFCAQCTRPDQDYGLAWIRTYGKGRTYFTPLGHTTIFYTDHALDRSTCWRRSSTSSATWTPTRRRDTNAGSTDHGVHGVRQRMMAWLSSRRIAAGLVVAFLCGPLSMRGQAVASTWVYGGTGSGGCGMRPIARGNRIMDFSHAGYKGGGVALPACAWLARSRPSPATTRRGSRPRSTRSRASRADADGFRGAVLLQRGHLRRRRRR